MALRKQGQMTVREAGQKGGRKVKRLIEEGRRAVRTTVKKVSKE